MLYQHIFANEANPINGLDQEVIEHSLEVNLEAKLVKQKMLLLCSERKEAANLEVERLLK